MIRIASALFLGTVLALAQDRQAVVNEHGDHVMGFSHDKTTHHFELHYDGGIIDVRADDVQDTATRDQIRSHFRHIAQIIAAGNFNAPMLVHGENVPGTAAMTQMKSQLHWGLQETPHGARITITADTKPAVEALHQFLKFQIEDHKTGDCTAVR